MNKWDLHRRMLKKIYSDDDNYKDLDVECANYIVDVEEKAKLDCIFTEEELGALAYNLIGIQEITGKFEEQYILSVIEKIFSLSKELSELNTPVSEDNNEDDDSNELTISFDCKEDMDRFEKEMRSGKLKFIGEVIK